MYQSLFGVSVRNSCFRNRTQLVWMYMAVLEGLALFELYRRVKNVDIF